LTASDAFIHAGFNVMKTLRRLPPIGEIQNGSFRVSFSLSLNVDFQGSQATSDGGLIVVRELHERLGSGDLIAQHWSDFSYAETCHPGVCLPQIGRKTL
jgi:hypothetical protein